MEVLKRPSWRIPLVLSGVGLLCRALTYILGLIWGRIQIAQGPGPDGSYVLTTGYTTEIIAAISFLLFWLAGWRFVRGLTRREIFRSASIMVLLNAALLAAEQISQRVFGAYSMTVYRLYALTEGTMWVDQLLIHLFDTVSIPVLIPGLFTPYLYLALGNRSISP